MFEATDWDLKEPEDRHVSAVISPKKRKLSSMTSSHHPSPVDHAEVEIAVLKRFQFSSSLQRMSVITHHLDSQFYHVYCKGSPEVLMSLSKRETVPEDILDILNSYTVQGYRVIAVGVKKILRSKINLDTVLRSDVETDLEFVGLLIFENKLKPQSAGVIQVLKQADMKVVMITGRYCLVSFLILINQVSYLSWGSLAVNESNSTSSNLMYPYFINP